MRIREATHDDSSEIVEELLLPFFESDEELDPEFNELDGEALQSTGCSYWIDEDDRVLFVAEDDGELVAHVSGFTTEEPPIYVRESRAHIDGLFVKEEYRRRGIASRLIDRMEAWAEEQGCDYLGVTAHENNEASRSLYAEGFDLKFRSYRRRLE